jgi:hypothetical protein
MNILSDEDLIDFVYCELAGQQIRDKITDFTDYAKWRSVVNEMEMSVATVYRIGIFNLEMVNGGLIQYFDNAYGIFAYETLADFKRIGANWSYQILETCLNYVNPENFSDERFIKLVTEREYEDYENLISRKLSELDDKYYELDKNEDLGKLLADYIRKQADL